MVPGTTADVVFTAREARPATGFGPMLDISEYGPKGPWWYEDRGRTLLGAGGEMQSRRRRRLGQGDQDAQAWAYRSLRFGRGDGASLGHDGGTGKTELALFRDLTVQFAMEVKRFPTQFHPGATECVPK